MSVYTSNASFRRQDDSIRGRHLIAAKRIQKNELVFCERPLCSLQSIGNAHKGALVCRACRAFCGGPSLCLKLASGSLNRQDVFKEDPSLKSCRQGCGEVYCSLECEQDFWKCHSFLCTGPIKDENHPLLEWKRHAISNNEIFLLVGDVLSAILAYPELKCAYTDFTMVPWWTVALLPFVDKPMGFSEATVLEASCRRLCDESASLFNQSLKMQGIETDLVTPLFVSQIIGAFEQNSIGIRARNPLCRDIFKPGDLLSCHLQDVICCLEEAGFIADSECADEPACIECPDNQIVDLQAEGETDCSMSVESTNADGNECDILIDDESNYTPDEIAEYLASLHIDETDGEDDLDAMFVPLDGTAMFSNVCKMNHSCDPNVVVVYRGLRWHEPLVAQCVARRDIEPGEELCISYIDVAQPLDVRERELANYGFVCACQKCFAERDEMVHYSDVCHTSEIEMSIDDDEGVNNDIPEETNPGDDVLQERLKEIETVADLSPLGSIPTHVFSEVQSFAVQYGTTLLVTLGESSEISAALVNCLASAKLRHFSTCATSGMGLADQLVELLDQNESTSNFVYRDAFCVAAIVASIGMAHIGSFLVAQALLDKATILGLKRDLIGRFFEFVEHHSNEMYECVLVAKNVVCEAPEFSAVSQGLSKTITLGIDECKGTISASANILDVHPFVRRGHATHWDAVSRWKSLSWFAKNHGHRLLPITTHVLGQCDAKPTMMTMRRFISDVLAPTCLHPVWNLDDSLVRPSASVSEDHALLQQIPVLLESIESTTDLCGKSGTPKSNLWMRGGGTRTRLQRDSLNTMMVQIVGATYVRLYSPEESSKLNALMDDKHSIENNLTALTLEVEDIAGPQIDALYKETVLFPGDSLFVPRNVSIYTRTLSTGVGVIYKW